MTGLKQFDLTERTALITGSSQGIGFALAEGLSAAGANIILNGRDENKLASAAARLEGEGAVVHQLAFDATDHGAVVAAIDDIEAKGTAIDICVNNAGMQHRAPLEEFETQLFTLEDRLSAIADRSSAEYLALEAKTLGSDGAEIAHLCETYRLQAADISFCTLAQGRELRCQRLLPQASLRERIFRYAERVALSRERQGLRPSLLA